MMYDPRFTDPMRQELTDMGVEELKTPEAVDAFVAEQKGTALLLVNSVCGCAAGSARPGLRMSLTEGQRPHRVVTVFAGVDVEATKKARSYFPDHSPSSPSFAFFKDGKVVDFIPRHRIEGRDARAVAADLRAMIDAQLTEKQTA
jgi:putative YphP/YqiW family bacilliredoxin